MRPLRTTATFLFIGFLFAGMFAPAAVFADSASSIVACTSADVGSTACTLCAAVSTVQNLINFAIGIAIPVVAILFGYAGALYFTSAVNPTQISKAHSIFKSAAIGFAFVLCGWLIVDTIIHQVIIANNPQAFQSTGGNWFQVPPCTGVRLTQNSVQDLLFGVFAPNGSVYAPEMSGVANAVPDQPDNTAGATSIPGAPNAVVAPEVQQAVDTLDQNALSASSGKCAYYVRSYYLAPAGYTDFNTNHPVSAADYGPYLTNDGFNTVASNQTSNFTPQKGDVAVFDRVAGHSDGHIQVWDGTQWVSDFKQGPNKFYPSSDYVGGSYKVYRSPSKPST